MTPQTAAIAELGSGFAGELIGPDHPAYDGLNPDEGDRRVARAYDPTVSGYHLVSRNLERLGGLESA